MNEEQATANDIAEAMEVEASEGVAPKKERQIFKGRVVPLGELDQAAGKAVQVMDPKATYRGRRVPGTIIVTRVMPGYARNHKYVYYHEPRNNFALKAEEFPESALFNILTGTVGEKYNADFKKWARGNLGSTVNHPWVTMGCDPEIFAVEGDDPEKVIPAWKFLGSKKEPSYTTNNVGHGAMPMYWDGFQAEFTTRGGITCLGYVFDSVYEGMQGVYNYLKKYDKKAKLSIRSVLPVDFETLQTESEEHVQFGCMPSYNAYGLSGAPNDGRTCPIRFAGGHIHFGMAADHMQKIKDPAALKRLIWHLDAIAGVTCVSLFEKWDNPARRNYYGLPGEYRLPKHGLEYRTLSNAWLCHPLIGNIVFEVARRAYALGLTDIDVWEATEGEVLDCILSHNVEVARAILNRNKDVFKSLMSVRPGGDTELLFNVVSRDMSETIAEPENLEKNWHLAGRWIGHTGNANATWYSAQAALRDGKKV